jgi:hypothetical protein
MAKRQTIQWQKDRQYNGKKTDNTIAKRQTIVGIWTIRWYMSNIEVLMDISITWQSLAGTKKYLITIRDNAIGLSCSSL